MIDYAVILAGGFGSRFLPVTKSIPKPMLPLIDRPAIEFVVKEAFECGVKNIAIVIGHQGEIIKDYFSKKKYLKNLELSEEIKNKLEFCNNVELTFLKQEKLDGTASAVKTARQFVGNNDFAILNADELFLSYKNAKNPTQQLIDFYSEHNACVVGTKRVSKKQATNFGVVIGEKISNKTTMLNNILEKPMLEFVKSPAQINVGRYVVKNQLFECLDNLKPNKFGEYALTDALVDFAKSHKVFCLQVNGKRYDLGNKFSFKQAYFDLATNDKILGNDFRKYVDKMSKQW